MKRIYVSMLAVFFFGATFAQNYNLTFQVDLGSATPSGNGVHVAGSFRRRYAVGALFYSALCFGRGDSRDHIRPSGWGVDCGAWIQDATRRVKAKDSEVFVKNACVDYFETLQKVESE